MLSSVEYLNNQLFHYVTLSNKNEIFKFSSRQDFLLYIFLTSLPKYLNNVHNFDVSHRKEVENL